MTIWHSDVVGVVLAGGASSRMGQDKASLQWQDGNLLDHMQQRLASVCQRVMVSGKENGIADQRPWGGPLLAIHSVLQHPELCDAESFIFCAVDTPFIGIEVLVTLRTALSSHVAAHFSQHYLPFALRAAPSVRETITTLATASESSQRSLSRLSAALNAVVLPLTPEHEMHFLNLNTPQLYARYKPQ